MRRFRVSKHWRGIVCLISLLVMALSAVANSAPAYADSPAITGTVVDSAGNPQANVVVNILDPSTAAQVASTYTDDQGDFSVSVASGTYNLEFIPPSADVQSYLATGISTDSAPLTVVLQPIVVVNIQGTLQDSQGNVYTSQQNDAQVTFSSPLNPGSRVFPDSSGDYSTSLLADQNFTASVFFQTYGNDDFFSLPVGVIEQDQTVNVTVPESTLDVSVQDSSGNPITGGSVDLGGGSVSSLPGIPGGSASITGASVPLDANGNAIILVPTGITPSNSVIRLDNGLVIPFTLHPVTSNRHALIIFNETTGTVTVDDQPPVVTGTPDRPANANGWYNAPVTITWSSTDSSGTATTPDPTTVSANGADQVITSGQSCDQAGNCATGSYVLNIDTTPPSVSVTGVTNGATYTGGQAPSPGCSDSDAVSGIATAATLSVTSDGNTYTATCSGATDNAGNVAPPVSVSYTVLPAGYTTASVADSNGNPLSGVPVSFRSASGAVTSVTTGSDGTASTVLAPGAYKVTATYANGSASQTLTVTANGPNTVSFSTVAVTVQVNDPDSSDIAAASVAYAGSTGTFGPKTPVSTSGQVIFQALPGTSTFTAYVAGGTQTQAITVSPSGNNTVTFTTVPVTVQINDPDSSDIAVASVAHAGSIGTFGPKTAVSSSGQVIFQALPGTSTFTAYDAGGTQTQSITVSSAGSNTVTYSTVAVTVTVDKNGSPLATATVSHAGNTGSYGPKIAVNSSGQVVFQVLPGASYFTAWDGSAYNTATLTVTTATSTTISVP
jgi:VCBS repeat-containing protein